MQKIEPYKLLIVDDESGIRESLKDFFELEGFQVVDSSGGIKALEMLKTDQFDVVLSDIRMPEGDGRFLLKSIRELYPIHPIVILMSGFSDVTPEEAYAEGATAILAKPFNPIEVMESVKAHLQHQRSRSWSEVTTRFQNKIKINALTLSEAIQNQSLRCGQNGLFLKLDPSGYRIGQDVEIELNDSSLYAVGIIRWIRTVETHDRIKGMGIELKNLSDAFKKQFLSILEKQTVTSIIPRT